MPCTLEPRRPQPDIGRRGRAAEPARDEIRSLSPRLSPRRVVVVRADSAPWRLHRSTPYSTQRFRRSGYGGGCGTARADRARNTTKHFGERHFTLRPYRPSGRSNNQRTLGHFTRLLLINESRPLYIKLDREEYDRDLRYRAPHRMMDGCRSPVRRLFISRDLRRVAATRPRVTQDIAE